MFYKDINHKNPMSDNIKCKSQSKEICMLDTTQANVCDGNSHCEDESDEAECRQQNRDWKFSWGRSSHVSCYELDGTPKADTTYTCRRGPCIDLKYVCDGHSDCPHGDDEQGTGFKILQYSERLRNDRHFWGWLAFLTRSECCMVI